MKAELTKDGYLKVTAETIAEAWALNITHSCDNFCTECNRGDVKLIIDGSILMDDIESQSKQNPFLFYPVTGK